MGAYLKFRLADSDRASEANEFLDDQPEQDAIRDINPGRIMDFWCQEDHEWMVEHQGERAASQWYQDIGEGDIKTSGIDISVHDELMQLYTDLFEKLHDEFDVEVYSKSCSLNRSYFTEEQIRVITNDGDALTGPLKTIDELLTKNEPVTS